MAKKKPKKVISGNKKEKIKSRKSKKSKNSDKKKRICGVHECGKTENLKQCKYCKNYFCKKHLKPHYFSVGLDNPNRYPGDDGHPCIPYTFYKEEKLKKEKEERYRPLEKSMKIKRAPIKDKFWEDKNYLNSLGLDEEPKEEKKVIHKKILPKKFRKRKKKKSIKKFISIILILLLIFLIYSFWPQIISLINSFSLPSNEGILLDEKTEEIFSYINDYRKEFDSPNLTYSTILYPYIKEIIKEKDINQSAFENSYEFNSYLEDKVNMSGISFSYYKTYFVNGKGIEGFKEKFNGDYSARRLIRDEKYKFGAVYCSLDNCLLFVFKKDKDIQNFLEDNINTKNKDENDNFFQDITEGVEDIFGEDPEDYKTGPKTINLVGVGNYVVYQGVNDYLAGLERSISYYTIPPTTKDFILRDLDNKIQEEYLSHLVDIIKTKSDNQKVQADISIKMVQSIPYDWEAFKEDSVTGRYPYEVLYDMKGVCMEKSDLLAYILRDLGFGVAIFEFNAESHRAVGIKCDNGNYGSNYCFIESTDIYPIGQIPPEYVGGVDIRGATPEIIIISEGDSY
jgi:hypothetical protein